MTEQNPETGAGQRAMSRSPRQRAIEAYEDAGRRAVSQIEEAPLIALAGGLAAGALIAALLPRTESETKLLRPVGDRVKTSAKAAATAAREAGTSRLTDLGLTKEKGSEALRSIFESVTEAARTSAQEALGNNRKSG